MYHPPRMCTSTNVPGLFEEKKRENIYITLRIECKEYFSFREQRMEEYPVSSRRDLASRCLYIL